MGPDALRLPAVPAGRHPLAEPTGPASHPCWLLRVDPQRVTVTEWLPTLPAASRASTLMV
jgi:hypothetical protein